jgi:hypothetical protein
MVMEGSFRSTQFSFLLGGLLVVAGCRLTFSLDPLVLLSHLRRVLLRLLSVLLGEGAVLGRLAPMRVDRPPKLLSLRCVSVRLLAVARCLGGKPLSHDSLPLGAPPHVGDESRECGNRDHHDRDNENR